MLARGNVQQKRGILTLEIDSGCPSGTLLGLLWTAPGTHFVAIDCSSFDKWRKSFAVKTECCECGWSREPLVCTRAEVWVLGSPAAWG